jgi:hypothetical protein
MSLMTSRGVKCSPGRLVRGLGKLPDQFLEGKAHVMVTDPSGVEVEAGEFLGHLVEQRGLAQPVHLLGKPKPLEDVSHRLREALDVGR